MFLPSITDVAKQASDSLDRDGLLFAAIVALAAVVAYLFKDAKKTAERVALEHGDTIKKVLDRLEQRTIAYDEERTRRIEMLMQLIKDETLAKIDMTNAIQQNTAAIQVLKETFQSRIVPKLNC